MKEDTHIIVLDKQLAKWVCRTKGCIFTKTSNELIEAGYCSSIKNATFFVAEKDFNKKAKKLS